MGLRAGIIIAAFAALAARADAITLADLSNQPPCDAIDTVANGNPERMAIAHYACRLPVSDATLETARGALGTNTIAVQREGETLTVFAHLAGNHPHMGGSLWGDLENVGDDIWIARYHLAELNRAILTVAAMDSGAHSTTAWLTWRGPDAPAAPAVKFHLEGIVLDRTLWSDALHETRRLKIYLPPDWRRDGDYPTLFLADGGAVNFYAHVVEAMIDAHTLPPMVIVGALSGQEGIVEDRSALHLDLRSADYVPDFPGAGERFQQHMRFFATELVAYAEREFAVTHDPARRAVNGQSNGGSLALWAGLLHPEVFSNAFVSSQAGDAVETIEPTPMRARFFFNAGLYESPFLFNARHSTAALRTAGYKVEFETLAAGHMNDQTQVMLARDLITVFGQH